MTNTSKKNQIYILKTQKNLNFCFVFFIFYFLFFILIFSSSAEPIKVDGIKIEDQAQETKIVISTSQPTHYHFYDKIKTGWLIIDIDNAIYTNGYKEETPSSNLINKIFASQYKNNPPTVRFALKTTLASFTLVDQTQTESNNISFVVKEGSIAASTVFEKKPKKNLGLSSSNIQTTESEEEIFLTPSESKLLTTTRRITNLAIGNPEIADVSIISPKEILINAKKAGTTTLIIWDKFRKNSYTVSVANISEGITTKTFELKNIKLEKTTVENEGRTIKTETDSAVISELEKVLTPLVQKLTINSRLGSITASGTKKDLKEAERVIHQLDIAKSQIMFESSVYEVSSDVTRTLGITWTQEETNNQASFNADSGGGILYYNSGETIEENGVTRNLLDTFKAKMTALETESKAKTLANPRVATIDGKTAYILVGTKYPILVTYSSSSGTTQSVEYVEAGVKLAITPKINESGNIITWFRAEQSTITGYNGSYPIISTRETETELRLKNKDTVIIAGLKSTSMQETVRKIPILGDIPLLGFFFSTTTTQPVDRDIIISLTPTLLQ
jgi:type II secretory pathway component GspD/PulD (secretin)